VKLRFQCIINLGGVFFMSNSNAKKKRIKLLQSQDKDVTISRNMVNFSTHVRKTKTKKETKDHQYKKYRKRYDDSDTSFFLIDKIKIVAKIQIDPIQSIQPNETPKNITVVNTADKGSAHANKLVSDADRYFRLCK